jgi:hypothetical protein
LVEKVGQESGGVLDEIIESLGAVARDVMVQGNAQILETLRSLLNEAGYMFPGMIIQVQCSRGVADASGTKDHRDCFVVVEFHACTGTECRDEASQILVGLEGVGSSGDTGEVVSKGVEGAVFRK